MSTIKSLVFKYRGSRFGFTLIELLVVIAILGILATIGVVSFRSTNQRARDSKRKADLEQIRAALEIYRADFSEYPLRVLESGGWEISGDGDWLENLPIDYMTIKPEDPLDDGTYLYRYAVCNPPVTATGQPNYKLQAKLETDLTPQKCGSCSGDQGGTDGWYCVASP